MVCYLSFVPIWNDLFGHTTFLHTHRLFCEKTSASCRPLQMPLQDLQPSALFNLTHHGHIWNKVARHLAGSTLVNCLKQPRKCACWTLLKMKCKVMGFPQILVLDLFSGCSTGLPRQIPASRSVKQGMVRWTWSSLIDSKLPIPKIKRTHPFRSFRWGFLRIWSHRELRSRCFCKFSTWAMHKIDNPYRVSAFSLKNHHPFSMVFARLWGYEFAVPPMFSIHVQHTRLKKRAFSSQHREAKSASLLQDKMS